jgi:glycosyltransferase involved in cell wall biosynthesis
MADPDPRLPFVSVIIPVFNDQRGIDECISAMDRQSYPAESFEVIVVDNASEVLIRIDAEPAFQPRVIRCELPGSYAARNAGLEVATGDVLAFTDADCIPDAGWISNGVAALGADLPCIVGGDVRLRLSSRPSAVELYQGITGFAQRENIEKRGFTVTANLFAPREAFANIGVFDTKLLSGGDLEWSRRATANGYALVFAADAVVETLPRTSLGAAARQVRRVTGGRKALRSDEGGSMREHIGPRRGPLASLRWILGHSELGWWDRLRVLAVATVLYGVRVAERVMLALGRDPERR